MLWQSTRLRLRLPMGRSLRRFCTALLLAAFLKGASLHSTKIRDIYLFIVQNYREGDEILLFGFSRGAYTVRKVAGLLVRF